MTIAVACQWACDEVKYWNAEVLSQMQSLRIFVKRGVLV